MCGCKIFTCEKRLCFWKTSIIIKKSLLLKNVLDCGKRHWQRKNICLWENYFLWKTSLIKEKIFAWGKLSWSRKKSFLVKNFLTKKKIFVWGKLPRSRKILIWKSFFDQRKCWLVEKFFDRGKIIGLSLLKIMLCHKTNSSVETIKIHKFRCLNQTLDPLTFLLTKKFSSTGKLLSFCGR